MWDPFQMHSSDHSTNISDLDGHYLSSVDRAVSKIDMVLVFMEFITLWFYGSGGPPFLKIPLGSPLASLTVSPLPLCFGLYKLVGFLPKNVPMLRISQRLSIVYWIQKFAVRGLWLNTPIHFSKLISIWSHKLWAG